MANTITITTVSHTITITQGAAQTVSITNAAQQSATLSTNAGTPSLSGLNSDALSEGSTNLYHTTARARAAAPVQSVIAQTGIADAGVNLVTSEAGVASITNTKLGTMTNVTMPSGYAVGTISGAGVIAITYSNLSTIRSGLGLGSAAVLNTGITNTNIPKFTTGVADDDFLRVNGTDIEGRSSAEVLSDIGGQASLTFGISNTNAVKVDAADVADDEYARFTANGLESRSTAEVLSDIGAAAAAHAHLDAYTGHIETVADKVYTIDPAAAGSRIISGFYIKSGSGTVTATLKNGTDVVKAVSVSTSSGDQSSLANTTVAANGLITITMSSNSSATDVIFSVEYIG